MTHEHITGFASELVQMAQAMARVPELEKDLSFQYERVAIAQSRISELETLLEASRTYAAALKIKVRTTEASRDDAELRLLEADDAKDTLVRILDNLGKDILGALQAVAPIEPKATHDVMLHGEVVSVSTEVTPELKNEPSSTITEDGQRTVTVTPLPSDWHMDHTAAPEGTQVGDKAMEALTVDAPLVGQSVVDPTPHPVSTEAQPQTVSSPIASTPSDVSGLGEGVSVPSDPTPNAIIQDGASTTSASDIVTQSEGALPIQMETDRPLAEPFDPASPADASSSVDIGDTEHISHFWSF
jgi:hypothetical protein